MSIIVVNVGEEAFLTDGVTGVAYDLRLFKADVTAGLTPAEIQGLDESDFVEATFTGYAAVAVAAVDWTITQGDPTEAANVEKAFVSSTDQSPQNIFGYYVTRTADGALMWFEEFEGPVVVEFLDDEIDVTPTMALDDAKGNAVETGTVTFYGGEAPPSGWLLCDGAAVSRTTFDLLFAVIGTAYGPGDGSTTFNVPDLRQRFPMGVAASGTGATLGDTGGAIDHVHDLDTSSSHARINVSTSNVPHQQQRTGVPSWTANRQGNGSGANSTFASTTATQLGGDSDIENPPYVTLNGIIKT